MLIRLKREERDTIKLILIVITDMMYNIIYNKEILDTADTKEEAEYIAAEYNCAFRQNGAVVFVKA